jgi:hypothetical protein
VCAVCVDAAGRHTSSTVNRWEIGRVENRISPQSVLFFFLRYVTWSGTIQFPSRCWMLSDGWWALFIYYLFRLLRVLLCRTHAASGDYMARSWSIDD